MTNLFLNSSQKWRLIWRFLFFFCLFAILNVPLQKGLQVLLPSGLLRSNISTTVVLISILLCLWVQVKWLDKTSFEKYGMAINRKWFLEFGFGTFVAAFQISFFFVSLYWSNHLTIVDSFVVRDDQNFASAFLTETYRQLQVGIFEEIISRAFLFIIAFELLRSFNLGNKASVLISCVLNSLVFGFLHLGNEHSSILSAINLSLDALTLCVPFLLTGRLGMSIGMHFSWNLMQGAIFGFANSGMEAKASLLSIESSGHPITGGEFGPEGSTALMILSGISLGFIYLWKRLNKIENWLNLKVDG